MNHKKPCNYECTGQKTKLSQNSLKRTLKGSLLRLLGSNTGTSNALNTTIEPNEQATSGFETDHKMQLAYLEAELKKAEAIKWERQRRTIC